MASSNLRKFRTANPIAGGLIDRLYREVAAVAVATEATSLLDAGCGEGEALARLGDRRRSERRRSTSIRMRSR